MRPETQAWLAQANADLDAATRSLASGIFYLAAFCAHQAAEKALKALCIERLREMPPKTHRLDELWDALSQPATLEHDLRALNPHYTVARYPDAANGVPAWNYDRALAEPLVEAGARVVTWVTSELTSAR